MEELDRLAADFAARGYEPEGAELEDEEPPAADTHGHHQPPSATQGHGDGVRRFTHRGHEVETSTRYEVTIDGEPWNGHIAVLQDGSVVYHGLPQYEVPSAVYMIRTLIDYEKTRPGGPPRCFPRRTRGGLMAVVRRNVLTSPQRGHVRRRRARPRSRRPTSITPVEINGSSIVPAGAQRTHIGNSR